MTFLEVLVAVVLGLVANEIFDITPWAANALVRAGAAFAFPGDRRHDRAEEWMALLHDRPGKLFNLMTALGLCGYAFKVGIGYRARVRLAEIQFGWRRDVRRLRRAGQQPGTLSLVGGAWLIGDAEDGLTLVELRYGPADPFAISVVFYDEDEPVEWVFGRELLADGVRGEAGLGDLRFFQEPGLKRLTYLWMGLSSPDGNALFALRRRMVRRFLAATYALVPRGAEPARLDIDGTVGRLLS